MSHWFMAMLHGAAPSTFWHQRNPNQSFEATHVSAIHASMLELQRVRLWAACVIHELSYPETLKPSSFVPDAGLLVQSASY